MHIFPKLHGILSFPNLLSCITLIVLLDTCIFAPMVHTRFGPFPVGPGAVHSTIAAVGNNTEEFPIILGDPTSPSEQFLTCHILIAKLYSTQIIDEFEFLDSYGVAKFSRLLILQSIPLPFTRVMSNIRDLKFPLVLNKKLEQMKVQDSTIFLASSLGNLYTTQKVLRLLIICLTVLSCAANTIVFDPLHHIAAVSTDIALVVSCTSLILTLSISQFRLPMRYFSTLISQLFLCSLSISFNLLENLMARRLQNLTKPSQDSGLSIRDKQVPPSTPLSRELKIFDASQSQNPRLIQYEEPIRDEDTISLDLEGPIMLENNYQQRELDLALLNPNLVTASDFDAILSTNTPSP